MPKLRYTYTVAREENVTKKDLKEYGDLMEEDMTIEKYRDHMQAQQDDEGGEYLYGGCDDKSLDVKVEIV